MAYDEGLAHRVREALAERSDLSERKMFGGLCFMLGGNMCCGIVDDRLMLRLGREGAAEALAEPHTSAMDFTGKVIRTMIYVEPAGIASDKALTNWVNKAVAFAEFLPPK